MPASVRPYVTAGVALVGASVISVTPIQPVTPQTRIANDAYSLTAASVPGAPIDGSGDGTACSGYHTDQCDIWAPQSYTPITVDTSNGSILNVPANILNAIISVPRAYLDGLNDLSYALEVTGSWWVYDPVNVLGYDPADPPKITAVTNLLIPFKALSNPLGEHVSWWAKANLPMNSGCTGTAPPTCQDAGAILSKMFTAPIWDLIYGYTFPALNNPVSDAEGAAGEAIPGEEGAPVPWSGAHIQINPYDPIWNVINYMLADPEQNRPEAITLKEVGQSLARFGRALWQDFNPFVPGSFLWKGFPYTLVTPFIKPFVKVLCPSCDPEHPEDPTPFDGQLPPSSQAKESNKGVTNLLEKLGLKKEETTSDTATLAAAQTEQKADATTEATTTAATTEESATKGGTSETPEATDGAQKGDVVKDAVANLLKKFEKAPAETTPATDATDTDGKTDAGTPATDAGSATTDKGGDDASAPSPKKWSFGGKHRKSEDTTKSADAGAESSAGKSSSESKSETKKDTSDAKKDTSGSKGAKAGAGSASSSNGSDSGGSE
ncbi:MAG: hypothetical protein HZB45_01080 [Mycolicibacterium rufum]|nr:hypothetical protein [Mycolicibacterium rufum]